MASRTSRNAAWFGALAGLGLFCAAAGGAVIPVLVVPTLGFMLLECRRLAVLDARRAA